MDTSLNTARAFTDAIKKMAARECERINEETERIKTQGLADLTQAAKSKYNDYIDYELSRISAQRNRKIAELDEASRCRLSALRQELFEAVFSKLEQELVEFTKTEEYRELLSQFVKEIYEKVSDRQELVFFIRGEDMAFKEEINDTVGKYVNVTACDDIKIGGIKAVERKSGCLYDSTLDSEAQRQKDWFLENSGLKI